MSTPERKRRQQDEDRALWNEAYAAIKEPYRKPDISEWHPELRAKARGQVWHKRPWDPARDPKPKGLTRGAV